MSSDKMAVKKSGKAIEGWPGVCVCSDSGSRLGDNGSVLVWFGLLEGEGRGHGCGDGVGVALPGCRCEGERRRGAAKAGATTTAAKQQVRLDVRIGSRWPNRTGSVCSTAARASFPMNDRTKHELLVV